MKKVTAKGPEAASDMRAEYDFAGGVRGKHYRAMQGGYSVTIVRADGAVVTKEIRLMDWAAFEQAQGFIFSDVEREVQLARVSQTSTGERALRSLGIAPGGGNFLAALGLLCYTEFAGRLKYRRGAASENFNKFFDDLGPDYQAFRVGFKRRNEVYDIFRCGLAHEYYVKKSCTIAMLAQGPGPGIGRDSSGRFYFIVESYGRDLQRAFDRLAVDLYGSPVNDFSPPGGAG
ncbi:MAG: hypothetical protein FJ315_03805 [SAR202 cluster bacterium]|nr:hypothetical protein [SAR202 cluster bacterium]